MKKNPTYIFVSSYPEPPLPPPSAEKKRHSTSVVDLVGVTGGQGACARSPGSVSRYTLFCLVIRISDLSCACIL